MGLEINKVISGRVKQRKRGNKMENKYRNADGTWKCDYGLIPCGSVVKYTEKWSRPEERAERFVILESHDKGALIGSLTTKCVFGYMERVDWEMIEVAEC